MGTSLAWLGLALAHMVLPDTSSGRLSDPLPEQARGGLHALDDVHAKGTPVLAHATADALARLHLQRPIVVAYQRWHAFALGNLHLRQVIELVDVGDVDTHGAGMAVPAVGAESRNGMVRRRRQHIGIVAIGLACHERRGGILHLLHLLEPDETAGDRRSRERIVKALGGRERHAKGRTVRVEQATARKGLHHREADVVALGRTVELQAIGVHALDLVTIVAKELLDIRRGRLHVVGGVHREHHHVDLARLASDGDTSYTYDVAGNRMTRPVNGKTITYTLGVGDRLASWTDGSYEYDTAGCVTQIVRDGKPTLDLTWNSQYQLVSVATNGAFAESYTYDALSRRVSTTTLEGTMRHVYDVNWQCIADIDEHDNVVASYVWGNGIDKLLAVTVGGATYYPLTDVQGTVWGYADSSNNIVARWQYDAWGNVVDEEVSIPVLAKLRYRFQGREWSVATGLVNFRMRWYDSETGRWLSKDPIGISGGLNLYAFCGNDTINNVDSKGLFTISLGISGGAGFIFGFDISGGVVAGWSEKNGFQFGFYGSSSVGSYIGAGGSIGVTFGYSNSDDICGIRGSSVTSGASGYGGVGGGGDFSVPLNGDTKNAVYSGTVGLGVKGGDVHAMPTITGVIKVF